MSTYRQELPQNGSKLFRTAGRIETTLIFGGAWKLPLDEAFLDAGDPWEFGQQRRSLRRCFPPVTVLGGCSGTHHHHVDEFRRACRLAA